MQRKIYRYCFEPTLDIAEVEASLLLALLAAESLHGESRTKLDARHAFDAEQRRCVIDTDSDVGRDLNRLFIGFLRREFGDDAFRVRRVQDELIAEAAA